MKFPLAATALAALLAVNASTTLAQDAPPTVAQACKADRQKFCADMKPGDGKLAACMKQHEAELSPECAAARKELADARRNIRLSCKADTDKFCADAARQPGGLVKCLEGHASEIGEACAEALKARPGAKRPG